MFTPFDLTDFDPFQRRETIVVITVHWPFCVEKSFLRHLISSVQPSYADLTHIYPFPFRVSLFLPCWERKWNHKN